MYFLVRFSDRFSNKSTSSRHSVLIKRLRLKNSSTQRLPPHTAYFTVQDIGIQWEKIMSVYICLFFVLEYFCISFSLRFSDFQINWHPQGTSGWLSMLTKQLRLKNSLTQRPPQHMSPMLNTWPWALYPSSHLNFSCWSLASSNKCLNQNLHKDTFAFGLQPPLS